MTNDNVRRTSHGVRIHPEDRRVARLARARTDSLGYPAVAEKVADLRYTDAWIAENPERWETLVQRTMDMTRSDRDADGAAKQLRARWRHDTYDRLPQLTMPVLLATGAMPSRRPAASNTGANRFISFLLGGSSTLGSAAGLAGGSAGEGPLR